MPVATIKCLQYVTGSTRRRQPRSPAPGTYPAGLGPISCYVQQPPNTYVQGSAFTAPYAPSQFNCGAGLILHFAFQSVTGLIEGGQKSVDLNDPCHGTVGVIPITVTNVYIPFGGTGPGGANGAAIDAFNEETGNFCDDTFVSVNPDTSGALTTSGNVFGWVSSARDETINAAQHIMPSNVYFHQWHIVDGSGDASDSSSGRALTVGKNSNPYAFAFYGVLTKPQFKELKDFKEFQKENLKEHLKDNIGQEKLIHKDYTPDKPIKEIKEAAFEGDPWTNPGDPAYSETLQRVNEKLAALEKQVSELGKAFIRVQERPEVGKQIAKKGKNLK